MALPKVIIALDFENKNQALDFIKKFDEPVWVKVGMQLFYSRKRLLIKMIHTYLRCLLITTPFLYSLKKQVIFLELRVEME